MEEWLGFSGQDARKSWFWKACDAAKQKKIFWLRLHLGKSNWRTEHRCL
ncbi:hypothetical protein SBX64_11060 [Vibrio rhizosphaerae]|uniref:Uncharacterized protein n=1 Tax=Vibrio rhizosphaerae TaxID=398736 RepID=A0ABU4IUK6_9VIBR|nr:hypothetical protein [Vibrio rhizosphaerae]MDW6093090.1 hypothetical protein [Vibrio rhizosphaerae]